MSPPKTSALNRLLADHQVLYQKLRHYHWNVTGALFFGLHAKFEELYTATAVVVDDLAERILALGGQPLGTLGAQLQTATLAEDSTVPDARTMVANLIDDLETLNGGLRSASREHGEVDDAATINLLDAVADANEKTVWMLKAFLSE